MSQTMETILFESGLISFACTSDTHNENATDRIPDADVFLHAGDMTDDGTLEELVAAYNWIAALPHKVKVVVAGNHDVGLDPTHSAYSEKAHSIFVSSTAQEAGIHYLDRETREVARFRASDGSVQPLRVYGNASSVDYKPTNYAFRYKPHPDESSIAAWQSSPVGSEHPTASIWLMHAPPLGRLDNIPVPPFEGCELQAKCVARARPLLAVFGHFHDPYGVEKVTWDLVEDRVNLSEMLHEKSANSREFDMTGPESLDRDLNTLFINAAWMTGSKTRVEHRHLPWWVKINFGAGQTVKNGINVS